MLGDNLKKSAFNAARINQKNNKFVTIVIPTKEEDYLKYESIDSNIDEEKDEDGGLPTKRIKKKRRSLSRKAQNKSKKSSDILHGVFIERRLCFNESKIKEFLSRYKLPLNINNIRICKEHAASTGEDLIDMKPALNILNQFNPKKTSHFRLRKFKKRIENATTIAQSYNKYLNKTLKADRSGNESNFRDKLKIRLSLQQTLRTNRTHHKKHSPQRNSKSGKRSQLDDSSSLNGLSNLILF